MPEDKKKKGKKDKEYQLEGWQIKQRQELPLETKIEMSLQKITEWYEHWKGKCYVAFSGGKDSTALLHLVRSVHPDVMGVFADTGLEYPELRDFVKTFDNIKWVKPDMNYQTVLREAGVPIISKDQSARLDSWQRTKSLSMKDRLWNGSTFGLYGISAKWHYLTQAPFKISAECCTIMKKGPMFKFAKETGITAAYVGTMAAESRQRYKQYQEYGCNMFDAEHPQSKPLSFWTDDDVWEYIRRNKLPYASVYDNGLKRTGCMFCMYGAHFEKPGNTRFDKMKESHPAQYNFCMTKMGMGEILGWYINEGKGSAHTAFCDSNF